MATCNVMDDGYTKSGYIAKPEGFDADLHDGLDFTFRPMRVDEIEELALAMSREIAKGDAVRATQLEAMSMAKRIKSWSEQDKEGKPREVTLDAVRNLPTILYRRLRNIIQGISGSDPRPNQPVSAPQSALEKELELALKGQPPVAAVEQAVGN